MASGANLYSIFKVQIFGHASSVEKFVKGKCGDTYCDSDAYPSNSTVAKLLGLNPDDLLESLSTCSISMRGEVIVRPSTAQETETARDAMAKALFGRLFDWIVNQINRHLGCRTRPDNQCVILKDSNGQIEKKGVTVVSDIFHLIYENISFERPV